jgi:hypothetical protein
MLVRPQNAITDVANVVDAALVLSQENLVGLKDGALDNMHVVRFQRLHQLMIRDNRVRGFVLQQVHDDIPKRITIRSFGSKHSGVLLLFHGPLEMECI